MRATSIHPDKPCRCSAHLTPTLPNDIGDAAERVHVRLGEEGHRHTATTGAARPPNSMNV